MLSKLVKFIGCVIIIGVFAFTIMYEAMPDFRNMNRVKAADQSTEILVQSKNEKYIARCEKVLEILTQYHDNGIEEDELLGSFEITENEDTSIVIGNYNFLDCNSSDTCYSDYIENCGDRKTTESETEHFTYKINGHEIDWYCKDHNILCMKSPYKLSDTEEAKQLEKVMPGLCKWFDQIESDAIMVETTDHETVPLILEYGQTKCFKGINVDVDHWGASFSTNALEAYSYDNLTDVYEKMQAEGWSLKQYYVDGVQKGFSISTWENASPLITVIMDGDKITEIQISATDYLKEKKPLDSTYVELVNEVLNVAGIEDSIDDIYQMKNNGKGENYKVYVSKCGKTYDNSGIYDGGEGEEFQNYLIDIYDIQ